MPDNHHGTASTDQLIEATLRRPAAWSRRSFLAQLGGASWAALPLLEGAMARAALVRAQSERTPANLFEIEKAADVSPLEVNFKRNIADAYERVDAA